jgi:DNA-binding CsgD family transcriptional regulator
VATRASSALVGRAVEREALAGALRELPGSPGQVVWIEGDPGIGKSHLLAHLAAAAAAGGCTVLEARAAEFEADLPYALLTEALEPHLTAAGERRLARLGLADPGALSAALPPLAAVAPAEAAAADRHRVHRALRDLLARLAAPRPVVLCLDDLHWADAASLDALAALVRRAPGAPVLLALAARLGQMPEALAIALGVALGEDRVTRLELAQLSPQEAEELIGGAAEAFYPQAGGNPFYLEQLARAGRRAPDPGTHGEDGAVPPAVAAALAGELAALTPAARRLLEGAAVAGDPFEPGLAAEVAGLSPAAALEALDELLARALVRPGGAPRRFAFRHPIVRHAVYAATPGGWRLGAHGRAAAVLARQGAGLAQRAHHVEHAADPGDEEAIALLTAAAAGLQASAPASAARFHAAALRLLPEAPEHRARRTRARLALADAQAAAGDPAGARATLAEALATAGPGERLPVTIALANQEWWLGGHEDARRRLQVALAELPAQPSPDRVRLRLALGLTALLAGDLRAADAETADARDDARAIGDPVFEAAALASGALAQVADAGGADAMQALAASTAALERLTPEELATRLPALWMHGRARRMLGEPEAALADLGRGAAAAAATGRERVGLFMAIESVAALVELGRLAEAVAAGRDGAERARLSGNPRMRLWADSALASARLAAGDVAGALTQAQEAQDAGTDADFHALGQPGWCLGAALTAAGEPERAIAAMLPAFGGEALAGLLPADRPAAAADLVAAQLARGDLAAAEAALAHGRTAAGLAGTPWAAAVAGVAQAEVALAGGRAQAALAAAAAAGDAAAGAPLLRARALLVQGRSLAAAGRRDEALEALAAAESAFAGFGARRLGDQAVRELRRLGRRVRRPAREPSGGGAAPAGLTAREDEIARLVAAGRTNREIAEQLVLSTRTVEAHLRSVYGKLGVRTRVELARDLGAAGGGDA